MRVARCWRHVWSHEIDMPAARLPFAHVEESRARLYGPQMCAYLVCRDNDEI